MWLIMSFWIVITIMLYYTYKAGKRNKRLRIGYRQSKCTICNNYSFNKHACRIKECPNTCSKWEPTKYDDLISGW